MRPTPPLRPACAGTGAVPASNISQVRMAVASMPLRPPSRAGAGRVRQAPGASQNGLCRALEFLPCSRWKNGRTNTHPHRAPRISSWRSNHTRGGRAHCLPRLAGGSEGGQVLLRRSSTDDAPCDPIAQEPVPRRTARPHWLCQYVRLPDRARRHSTAAVGEPEAKRTMHCFRCLQASRTPLLRLRPPSARI